MARYHSAFTAAAPAAGAMAVDLRAPSGADRIRLLEVGWFNTTAVASTITLERLTTLGTQTTPTTPEAGDPGEAVATARQALAWTGSPVASNIALRKLVTPANIGAGCIWTFAFGDLLIPAAGAITLVNRGAGAAAALTGYFVYDE